MVEITQKLVRELFEYRDGHLYRKVHASNHKAKIGDKVGTLSKGYIVIRFNGRLHSEHRLIFLYHYGYVPKYIDHIDRNRDNNKIENLRKSSISQNLMNSKKRNGCSSQYKGVSLRTDTNKYCAYININGKRKRLGTFVNEIEAAKIYNKFAIKLFGEFAKLNEV